MADSSQERPARTNPKAKWAEKKGGKFQKKDAEVVKFEPGKYVPILDVTVVDDPAQFHTFEIDRAPFLNFSNECVSTFMFHSRRFNQDINELRVQQIFSRMSYMLLAKKLAIACPPSSVALMPCSGNLKKMTFQVPEVMYDLAEGFGVFNLHGAKFKPRHQEVFVFDSFVRALGLAPGNAQLCLDSRSFWIPDLSQYIRDQAVEFLENLAPVMFNGFQFKPPIPTVFNQQYAVWLGNTFPIPPNALGLLNALVAIDQGQVVDVNNLPDQFEANLNVGGVFIIQIGNDQVQQAFDEYLYDTNHSVSHVMCNAFKMKQVESMSREGSPWQLAANVNGNVTIPLEMDQTMLKKAMMLQGTSKKFQFSMSQLMAFSSGFTPAAARANFIDQGSQKFNP